MSQTNSENAQPVITPTLAVIFAVAGGVAVGNLYWAQPLLSQIAEGFLVPSSSAGFLVTATQIGYALGILMIVPLGDILDRKKLLALVMVASSVSLLASALAPSLLFLAFALAAVGCTTVSGQIILPMVGDLAAPAERGKMVGIVTSGITTGILLARTVSGTIANIAGWRSVYVIAVVLNLAFAVVVFKTVPSQAARAKIPYTQLLASVFSSVAKLPPMRRLLVLQGCNFLVFNLFWTSITFLLSAEPFGFDTFQIGLVSLAGITGAVASTNLGKLMDKGVGITAIGAFIALNLLSMALAAFAGGSLVLVVVVAALMSLANQGISILNQTTLFSLMTGARSRLNTAFVVNGFLCGAVGSAVASAVWVHVGWPGVCAIACVVMAVALVTWAASRTMLSRAVEKGLRGE